MFLLEMTADDISNMHYRDKNGDEIDAANFERNLIRILQSYTIIDDNAMTNNATDDADEMGVNRIISKLVI